jgi:hypothetical protein
LLRAAAKSFPCFFSEENTLRGAVHMFRGERHITQVAWPKRYYTGCVAKEILHWLRGQTDITQIAWPNRYYTGCVAKQILHRLRGRRCITLVR